VPVAYVQLKPGADVSEADLMGFVGRRIGERAAMPKAIRIICEWTHAPELTGKIREVVGRIGPPQ